MTKRYILALDQGTTSSRSILFDHQGTPMDAEQQEFRQIYPEPGWVSHNAMDIWNSQLQTAQRLLARTKVKPDEIAAIGITNQRETTLLWDRRTGEPVADAIVWQCRRSTPCCEELKSRGLEEEVRKRTGLVIDAYFSATKILWYFDNLPGVRERAEKGELCFGTIDSWLLYKLTGVHGTDYTNACRTMVYNIHEHRWDEDLLEALGIPESILPEVNPTAHVHGETRAFGGSIPVAALMGDQQAALFGQAAFKPLQSKNTYGTGCFVVMNTGQTPIHSRNGLITSIAWGLNGEIEYALEGSIFIAGAVIQWLRDELGLLRSAAESEEVAGQVPDSGGVYVVPAFVGLGAPYWDMRARGLITGLTRGTGRAHLVRAALESISFQTADVATTMEADSGEPMAVLRVDGGAAANNLLMQHQANVLGVPVERGATLETTALGAAYMAGLCVGFWKSKEEIERLWKRQRVFEPAWTVDERSAALGGWRDAVERTRTC